MKKLHFLFYAFLLVGSLACKKADGITDYKVQSQTDPNGYKYESVSNDPTGLRLYTLDNGLKVYLSQNKDEPTIQTYIPVKAGSNYDPKDNTGLAHYLEHMVFKGTDKIATLNWEEEEKLIARISDLYEKHKIESDPDKKMAIYREIDSVSYIASGYAIANEYDKMVSLLGASGTNAHTWYEETVYKNKIPANELEKWASLESERFGKLVLRLFHTELEAVYEEFNRTQDNDGRKAYYAQMEALFPTHPYGQQTTIGTSDHLKNPSMVAIKNYFDTYYVPNNMAVVLVGDLDFDKTIALIDSTFGKFKFKELKHPVLPKEEPLDGIVMREVFGPNNESVTVSFRTGGIGSQDQKYITLIDMILANSSAGLMDLNLNQKQLVQNATSSPFFQNDYGTLTFSGTPKAGQTLDEVKDLMLSQVELIKSGDFEDWMIDAVVNDLKLSETRRYENSTALASMYYNAFIHGEQWNNKIQFLDDLKKISKAELVAFANEFFGNNYVVVYKKQGEDRNIAKVENPGITPIQINRGAESEYLKEFVKIESTDLQPVFVDYKKEIQVGQLESGLEISNIKNPNNDLFSLNVIFDMGKDNDKKLSLAVGYLEFLGTDKYSPEDLKKEFYKLGINYSVSAGSDRSYVGISGLQENLEPGLELLEHLMKHVVADQEAYDLYVERILKSREDGKTRKGNILQNGLNSFAQYGEDSRLRNIYTAHELKNMDVSELVTIITDLNNFKHRIFYYGKDVQAAKSALNQHHKVSKSLKDYPPAKEYKQLDTGKNVYFTDFDMVQAEMYFIAKGEQFDVNKMALATVFNSYFGQGFSSVVLQEIRESKGLAYAAAAGYLPSSKKENYDRTFAYIGTQANKVPEAVEAMLNLLNNMPEAEQQFITAKQSALKQIASQRITKSNIFWNYEGLKKRGLDYDIREKMYKEIEEMTMADLSNFFTSNIKGQNYSVSVIGNKKDLDMQALKKLGKVHEMDIDYLFNYKETEVKQ
ncbi:M16 family metallopeptidase [Lutimonas zeaxanthinifaciens]|uniref:M16 family metallopeptidase n=1 Tax=Lutimonas zeaxanthinifaciens TaxID=3060215 RepID=UPI00265CD8A0|nr:M16 family metallopeptidase [Lutimonas sp. YSD2104]WKK64662.1 insulinase family protein [Lutimonas sp. YSD2104]